jgi:pSer/pThr/pTyr-binding forkhead associated (FHA) protein
VIGHELHQGTPVLTGEYGSSHVEAPLVGAVTRLGRGVSADVLLDHPTVSRRHALVVRREETLVLLDDRSMNGTWLNGERVSEAVLSDGDRIQLGAVELSFRFVD